MTNPIWRREDFVSGGYLLLQTSSPPDWIRQRPLLPPNPVSISDCIYPRFPDTEFIEWTDKNQSDVIPPDNDFQFDPIAQAEATKWATATFDVDHGTWGIFYTLLAAQSAARRILSGTKGVRLFGIGLQESEVANYLDETRPKPSPPGYAPVGTTGQVQTLEKGLPPEPGVFLGFEPLVTQFGLIGCSWICTGLESEFAAAPNEHGLVTEYATAADYAARALAIGAEPGIWNAWAITEYAF